MTRLKWIPNDNYKEIPTDVPILAELDQIGGGHAVCHVDENGSLWQQADGAGSVGIWTSEEVTRYVLLKDVLDRIVDVKDRKVEDD